MPSPWVLGAGAVAALLVMKGKAGGSSAGVADAGKVQRFAEAIAYAEGYKPGALPYTNNNPGDLKNSSVRAVGADAQGHLIFATPADGWEALRRQLELIVSGRSAVYRLEMSIRQMGAKYAEWSSNWSRNVASRLGVSEDTPLRALLT